MITKEAFVDILVMYKKVKILDRLQKRQVILEIHTVRKYITARSYHNIDVIEGV